MWLLIVPLLILFVIFLPAAALLAAMIAMLGSGWPLLLIAIGVWMLWRGDGRRFRKHRKHRGWDRGPWPMGDPATKQRQQPQRSEPTPQPRPLRESDLPIDVQVKVEQIRRKVDVLLGFADRFPPFSRDLYLVRQTADDYLPRTINAYLALPKQKADKPLTADGNTAHQELKTQLDLLDTKLDEIAQDLQRQDTDRLLANRRFLEARFSRQASETVFQAPQTGTA